MNMKLIGAPTIKDVVPGMVDISNLNAGAAPDTMFEANCESLTSAVNSEHLADLADERMLPLGVSAKL